MLWVFMTFQMLFDLVVIVFLLAALFQRRAAAVTPVEAPPAWQEELVSSLADLNSALNERLPQGAAPPARTVREEETKAPRLDRRELPGERLLISSLALKRARAGEGIRKIG